MNKLEDDVNGLQKSFKNCLSVSFCLTDETIDVHMHRRCFVVVVVVVVIVAAFLQSG